MRRYTLAGAKRRLGRLAYTASERLGAVAPARGQGEFPASMARWLSRRNDRVQAEIPWAWRSAITSVERYPRVAVVMHVFYPELVAELLDRLALIPVEFDLLVTNATGEPLPIDVSALPRVVTLRVLDVENRGRDILPLVQLVNAGLLEPYELVLKVHTKKSPWREAHAELSGTGEEWRSRLLDDLLGSAESVATMLDSFAADPALGMVGAAGSLHGPEFWGSNAHVADALLERVQLPLRPDALRFAAGSMYWTRSFVLQGLRALDLTAADFDDEAGQEDGTTAHAVERLLGILTVEAGLRLGEAGSLSPVGHDGVARYAPDAVVPPRARIVPFYLPQFHSFPENDAWWGKGFTEWSNVAAAKPAFRGHTQPLLPGELGFYDLRTPGVRAAQYELARAAGIEGFMYYYYWFAGRTLMSLPVEEHVAGDGDEPFCIMWANENWNRRWDGGEADILMAQDYDEVPATRFIHDVLHLVKDPRYIRVDGKPVIAVYRLSQIPDHAAVLEYWREAAREAGVGELHLLNVDVGEEFDGIDGDPRSRGLDGDLEFPPHNRLLSGLERAGLDFDERFGGNTFTYESISGEAEGELAAGIPDYHYPGVMVNYDNTARRQWQPELWYGSNPYSFRRWLAAAVSAVQGRPADQRIVFVNAWNEWAEAAVLEPSQRFGRTFLLAVRDVVGAPQYRSAGGPREHERI